MKKTTKLAAAVELGRLGGLKGGKARAFILSAQRRSEIARHAAEVRWASHENTPALQAQIKEGYEHYRKGKCKPVAEFMTELEKELKEDKQNPDQENRNRTKRHGR